MVDLPYSLNMSQDAPFYVINYIFLRCRDHKTPSATIGVNARRGTHPILSKLLLLIVNYDLILLLLFIIKILLLLLKQEQQRCRGSVKLLFLALAIFY